MKDNIRHDFKIVSNRAISRKTREMILIGDTRQITIPGQFVNISVPGKFLRRPISVGHCIPARDGVLTLYYDVVGAGTAIMEEMKAGDHLDILTGLGNGFNTEQEDKHPLLIGGGIGIAPMVWLAKVLKDQKKEPVVIMGFNTAEDIILYGEFSRMGIETIISTADGSEGVKGFVTDAYRKYKEEHPGQSGYFYACGPTPMLKALWKEMDIPGELSLDERMGCGFGACMCCSVHTAEGPKSICKDGPVFNKEILTWE